MCGRFTCRYSWRELHALYGLAFDAAPSNFEPRYNIAPMQHAAIVRLKEGGRALSFMRWGLVPSVAQDPSGGAKLINARAETLAEKPAFRSAFLRRRCLVVADGFYEWSGKGKHKQPWFFALKDAAPFAFAGLWEWWKPRDGSELLETFTIVTVAANETVAPLHERMPAILLPAQWKLWLGEEQPTPDRLKALLKPFPAAAMTCWPVDRRVGTVANDDAALVEPLVPEPKTG
jgi:putative SOS response-associated peptidase YedK